MESVRFANTILCCVILCVLPSTLAQVSSVNLTSPSGSFSTPTFPSYYPRATEYIWLIKAQDGMYIKLTFDVVDIEAYKGKCIDIVEVKDGNNSDAPILGGFCNANKPTQSFMSSSSALRIWFQSARNSDGGTGFNASYTTLKDQDCGGQLNLFPGSLSTPRYPLPYPNNQECLWNIVAPSGMYIYLAFHGVYHLEVQCLYSMCRCMDTLDIKDTNKPLPYPPNIGYCVAKPRAFTSKTNSVSLKFVAKDSGRYEGFNATYTTSLTPGCGADLHSNNGVITSPNFPHGYFSLSKCIWRITVAPGHHVSLNFQEFDVNSVKVDGACSEDSVEIHDGYTKDSPLLGRLCNANSVAVVNSTRNQMFILFQSGFNKGNAKGFKATYITHLKMDKRNRKPRHNNKHEAESSHPYKPSNAGLAVAMTSWIFAFLGTLALF